MAANPMNNKNLGRTHSKELAKNNRGKRTRKNSDYQTAATAARQAQAQSQAARKAPWPTKVKVTLGIMFGVLVACLVVRLAVPSRKTRSSTAPPPCCWAFPAARCI